METRHIKEIKNTDAFDVFNWAGDDLKKYNLIYGWNGSGKTTISRVFSFLERKKIHLTDLAHIEFSIGTDGATIKHSSLVSHGLNVRVFNEDFIDDNLKFEQSHAKKIVILGKENVEVQKEIETLSAKLVEEQKKGSALDIEKNKLPKLSSILTDAGSEVVNQFAGTPLASKGYDGRSYNSRKVEKHLTDGHIKEDNLGVLFIKQEDFDTKKEAIKSEREAVTLGLSKIPDFSALFTGATDVLNVSITTTDIERLKDDQPLRKWVDTGYNLHKERKLNQCQFCENDLPDEVLERLGKYFTDELQKARKQIEEIVGALGRGLRTGIPSDFQSSLLFPDLAKEYEKEKKELDKQLKSIEECFTSQTSLLQDKTENLHNHDKKYEPVAYPSSAIDEANNRIQKIENVIISHNQRVSSAVEETNKIAKELELHIIAKVLKDREYFKNKKAEETINTEQDKCRKECESIDKQIRDKKASLHNATDAVIKINEILQSFFGLDFIYLEVVETEDKEIQYVLKRRNKDAKHLSEGEASVLALVYFLVKLEEDECDKENCLIVIDDPVDSQDSSFLFRTSGLLKRQLNNAGQIVVLTHNFEFFNLVRDWYSEKQVKDKSALYFISHNRAGSPHKVEVSNLPALLKDYKSEYQYLFSRLYRYAKDLDELDEPLVANVARKILEYFSAFKWACKSTDKLISIVNDNFIADPDLLKRGAGDFVVKFLNEYSHGQDFSRAISSSMLESKEIAKNVMEFIRFADNEHYKRLEKLSKGEED